MKSIKSILLLVFLFCIANLAYAQKICYNYRGDWSSWLPIYSNVSAYRDGSGLSLKTGGGITYFDFWITNFTPPTKKELKRARETDEWFEYTGYVEYYVNDTYPNAEALAKANTLVYPNPRSDTTPVVKRKTSCTIKIAPYKKAPCLYFIIFDNISIEISVIGLKFGDKSNGGFCGKKRE